MKKTRFIVKAALIAAIYAVLTLAVAPISSGLMQFRISEGLCILPMFEAAAVPGLFLGCLLANLLVGGLPIDLILGSLATLFAALLTRYFAKLKLTKWLMPLPAVLINAMVVGWMLFYVYQVGVSLALCVFYVFVGQALSCYGIGMPLMFAIKKRVVRNDLNGV